MTFTKGGRYSEAIAVYDQIIAYAGKDGNSKLSLKVVEAMIFKYARLAELKRKLEADSVLHQIIAQFDIDTAPEIRERVGQAFGERGLIFINQAKMNWSDQIIRSENLLEAENLFFKTLERLPTAITLGNQAYIAWLQGKPTIAEEKFCKALLVSIDGGEAVYKGALGDLEMHPVDADAGFKELIDRLWYEFKSK